MRSSSVLGVLYVHAIIVTRRIVLDLPAGQRVVSFNGPCSSGLVCAWGCAPVLVPLEVGPIVADLTLRGYALPTRFFVKAS